MPHAQPLDGRQSTLSASSQIAHGSAAAQRKERHRGARARARETVILLGVKVFD
jgi:hypothetical protein